MRDAPRRGPGRRRMSRGFRRVDLRGAPSRIFLIYLVMVSSSYCSLSARAVSLKLGRLRVVDE